MSRQPTVIDSELKIRQLQEEIDRLKHSERAARQELQNSFDRMRKTILKEISQNKGTLYDSRVVEACLTCFHKKIFDFKRKPGRIRESHSGMSDSV